MSIAITAKPLPVTKIDWKKLLKYVGAGFALDIMLTKEFIFVAAGSPWAAALCSGAATLIVTYIITRIVKDNSPIPVFAYVLGNMLGTLVGIGF